jgi:DNA-binding PadR family transcriptional regulator
MTEAELVLLGMIAEKPRHGYELELEIEQRGVREWTSIGFSSIYYLLKKLAGRGLISGELVPGKRGSGKIQFRITPVGQQLLKQEILTFISEPASINSGLLVGLSLAEFISPSAQKSGLIEYRKKLIAKMHQLKHKADLIGDQPSNVQAMFDYSVAQIECEVKWLDTYIQKIQLDQP